MKKILFVICNLLLFSSIAFSQTIEQKVDTAKSQSIEKVKHNDDCGINKGKDCTCGISKEKIDDKFIDTDGDGVNDNRCKGLGIGTMKGCGKGLQKGKQNGIGCGQGKMKGRTK